MGNNNKKNLKSTEIFMNQTNDEKYRSFLEKYNIYINNNKSENENCFFCIKTNDSSDNLSTSNWKTDFISLINKVKNECFWFKPLLKKINEYNIDPTKQLNYFNQLNYINYKCKFFEEKDNLIDHELKDDLIIEEIPRKFLKNLEVFPEEYNIYNNDKSTQETNDPLIKIGHYSKDINFNKSIHESFIGYRNNTLISMMQCNNNEGKNDQNRICKVFHFKRVTEIIENHLNDKFHPLGFLKLNFLHIYKEFYKNLTENIENNNEIKDLKIIIENAVYDLQQFIKIFEEIIYKYYKFTIYKTYIKDNFFFNHENLLGFTTSILFEKSIYELLLKLQINVELEIENKINDNIKQCKNWSINEFGVPDKFSLNKKTLFLISKLKLKDTIIENNKQNKIKSIENNNGFLKYPIIETLDKNIFRSFSINEENFFVTFKNLSVDQNYQKLAENTINRSNSHFLNKDTLKKQALKFLKNKNDENNIIPFCKAIKNFQKIDKLYSPIMKLKNIIKTSIIIVETIKEFYLKNNLVMNYTIESDHILSIFLFICMKANIKNLFSQCKLIENFLTSKISNSISGYYLVTLKACLMFFSEDNIKKISIEKENECSFQRKRSFSH